MKQLQRIVYKMFVKNENVKNTAAVGLRLHVTLSVLSIIVHVVESAVIRTNPRVNHGFEPVLYFLREIFDESSETRLNLCRVN